ncbi:MAG: DUF305 domain-containing protein [Candidatus Moranbacteria bacterium]|nr:DUF305 domain-containing protein [Candidatus Moranbacteria bacterium]MBP9801380.1 DUF305 domain-containing protein [Candidatus Moranbacteria bacterium]
MQKISLALALSLALVSGLIGFGVGYVLTPDYAMYDKSRMDLGRPDRTIDLRYINAMISHHQGAILLAKQAEQSERKEVRDLAFAIQKSEPELIAELYRWKNDWYNDKRTVPDPLAAKLGDYNATFDLRFLNALVAHHESGILMTKEIRNKSSRNEVLDNADAVETFLSDGLNLLRGWRSEWYNL